MVCVPCFILPIILAIYVKFVQPFILRLFPQSWRAKFDEILYPTCRIPSETELNTLSNEAVGVNEKKID